MKRHKHYDTIVAWAEGKTIEMKLKSGVWSECGPMIAWLNHAEYRVKPEPKIIPFDFSSAKNSSIISRQVEPTPKVSYENGREISMITSFYEGKDHHGRKVLWIVLGNSRLVAEHLLSDYKFVNGEPCGVVVENK